MPTQISSREIIRRLGKEGGRKVRQRGSHVRFIHHDQPSRRVTVPHPVKTLLPKTLRSIYRQAGWDWDER